MSVILIVESDPHLSAVVAKLLNARGYRTRIESNGAAALLAAHEDLPAIIIMDLAMPILEGGETLHALRHDTRTAHIPVIVMASQADDVVVAGAAVAGANVYVARPPDPQALVYAVDRLVTLTPKDIPPS